VPQIIVKADRSSDRGEGAVMLRERVNVADFESDHFAAQLVERLGWAVNDAHEVEQEPTPEPEAPAAPQTAELSAQPAS
jgi:1,6-anhydro-N-acetylmuramate kinase